MLKNNIFNIKRASVLVVVAFLTFGLQAQDAEISSVYAGIDSAFSQHSAESLSDILAKNKASSSYSLYESYALKKTRQLIISNDLEFAKQTSLAIIDNNIENFDAVDLYAYIDRAIINEQAARQAEENRQQLLAERAAAAAERTKSRIESGGTYQLVNTASGSSVYMNESQQAFSSVDWTVKIGIADLLFQKVTDPDDYSSVKYGLSFGADLFYETENFILGGDIFADFQMLTMGVGEEEFMGSIRLVPELAFVNIIRPLFFRVGVAAYGLAGDSTDISGSVETFLTPVVGAALNNISIGPSKFSVHYDYYPGHFAYDDLTAAMEMGASLLLPLAENEKTKIGIELGVSDILFVKDNGIDNRCKAVFAIGVGNVNK